MKKRIGSNKKSNYYKSNLFSRTLGIVLKLHLWFWFTIGILCLIYQFINPPLTTLMVQRYIIRGYDWHQRKYISLKKIPKRTVRMIVLLEDPNFYRHFGFEWSAVQQAYKRNQRAGKIRFGASTISNQLARSLFLTTDRNYFRKYLEIQVTVIMEVVMTKNRMLELYLNYIEWGKGIYGIETASRLYYGSSVKNIISEQAMRLVSIITNPIKYNPGNYYNSRSARQRYNMLQRIY